jgi:hypothetical protein
MSSKRNSYYSSRQKLEKTKLRYRLLIVLGRLLVSLVVLASRYLRQ